MARKRKTAKPKSTRVVYRNAKAKPARRSSSRRARARGFMQELEPVIFATAGAVLGTMLAKKLPVAKSANGEKMKTGAIALATTYASAKAKNPMLKSILGGAAVGTGVSLVRQFAPTLLAGDDLLGYIQPLGSVEEARIYTGLNAIENLAGDDLLGDDLLGDDLLGDDLLGDDLLGDDDYMSGDFSPYSSNSVRL